MSAAGAEGGAVVLALGNVLVGDDGIGPAALAELLRTRTLPASVTTLDGGVLGMNLLGLLADAPAVLVLDAVDHGAAPGTPVRLEGDRLRGSFAARLSTHELGFAELLAATRVQRRAPARLVLWGVQPAVVGPHVGLSPQVAAAVPVLADAAEAELAGWGLAPVPRRPPGPARPYPDDVLGGMLAGAPPAGPPAAGDRTPLTGGTCLADRSGR